MSLQAASSCSIIQLALQEVVLLGPPSESAPLQLLTCRSVLYDFQLSFAVY